MLGGSAASACLAFSKMPSIQQRESQREGQPAR